MEVNFLIPDSCGPRRSVSVPFPAPTGRHRHIGGVPTDRDWDQGGTHRVSRRIDVVPCPAEVDLRDTMKIGRLQP